MSDLTMKRVIIIALAIIFAISLIIVQAVEVNKHRETAEPEPVVSEESQACVDCHERPETTPGMVAQWKQSLHSQQGIDCMTCHKVEKDDFDYFTDKDHLDGVAGHPTPKDCAECHQKEVDEFYLSKHSATSMLFFSRSFDRTVLEPTLLTKHGCQECHNIGHVWPDQSVGECDACHSKHSFDVAIARNPYTCGECHIGPDHPHIEIWLESKHGNVFTSDVKNMELLGYNEDEYEFAPFDAPTCTTCHMDAAPGLEATHDVGARMGWETQSPYSIRTTEAWGGGGTWDEKRARMEKTCYQCHSPGFVERYLLVGDLTALQYNEIYREAKRWLNAMNDAGVIVTPGFEGLAPFTVAGYDEEPERISYHIWHHEGRRMRHGALMMGADYTQWHGIWDLQHDLVEIINYAAEHGLPEAEAWEESDDPDKFWLYPFYDVPGTAWGIDTIAFRKGEEGEHTTKILMNRGTMPDYWDRAYANVKAVYENGLLSRKQWELVQYMFDHKEEELGQAWDLSPLVQEHADGLAVDSAASKEQVIDLELPYGGAWDWSVEASE